MSGLYARDSRLLDIEGEVKIVGSSDERPNEKSNNADNEVVYGCRLSDFEGDYTDKVAVLFRGACKFEVKILNAVRANVSAVVVINNNPEGVITMSIGGLIVSHSKDTH